MAALCLLALAAADLLQLTRASGLAATACLPGYFRAAPEVPGFIFSFRDEIANVAASYDLPAELVAAVIVNHQVRFSARDRLTDCVGSALGADVSLGLAQVRLSTAAHLDGTELEFLSAVEFRRLRSQLLDRGHNIDYQVRELRALLDQANRYPGISAEALIHDPSAMSLLITEYRLGRLGTPKDASRRSGAAFDALRWIETGEVVVFGRNAIDARRIRSEIRSYLQHIYCDSGIFNASACEWWQRRLSSLGPI